jgi:serine/threonine-protein kinase RsbT
LARNVFRYAGSGIMRWQALDTGGRIGIELTFEDRGPGITDIEQAMEAGYTSGGGLGLGLPGAKRLMDEFEIASEIGKGTIVTAKKWHRRLGDSTS